MWNGMPWPPHSCSPTNHTCTLFDSESWLMNTVRVSMSPRITTQAVATTARATFPLVSNAERASSD